MAPSLRSLYTAARRSSRRLVRPNAAVLVPFVLAACADATSPTRRTPREGFVTVAPGVRLHYIDYGGRGAPLVLLAGLGNTAHVFESFAPRLTGRFHVIALTRRGFGASSQPAATYDTRTLSEDVRIMLDSLRLARVHLVGHSVAGDEMTRLAGDHPDRVAKLVYLDAAYDRVALSEVFGADAPAPPAPTPSDIGSIKGFSRYVERVRGVRLPVAELRATFVFAPNGAVAGAVTPPEVSAAIVAGEERPDYSRVRAPALGVFAVAEDAADVVPWLTPSSPDWAAAQAFLATVLGPLYEAQRARFDAEVATSDVLELDGANHYVFLSDPARVAGAVLGFLGAP